jgi:hypothetical protein
VATVAAQSLFPIEPAAEEQRLVHHAMRPDLAVCGVARDALGVALVLETPGRLEQVSVRSGGPVLVAARCRWLTAVAAKCREIRRAGPGRSKMPLAHRGCSEMP